MPEVNDRTPAIRPIEFWTDWENDPRNPGQKIGHEWVRWVKIGETNGPTTAEKVARLQGNKARNRGPALEWEVIEPYYKAWKEGQEPPVDGTALAAWPGASKALVEALADRKIKTVEDFATMPDHEMAKIPIPNIRFLWSSAKNFLKAQEGASAMEAALSQRDNEIEALKRQMADLMEARSAPAAEPKKRGRPRKEATDDEAEADAA